MNLENINIDEVVVKLRKNELSFMPLSSIDLSGLSGNIYQILTTDSYIYVMTSTNFYQLNLDGSVYNMFTYSSLPLAPISSVSVYGGGKYFDIINNNIYIFLQVNYKYYIYLFNSDLNLIKYIHSGNSLITNIHIYNNKLYVKIHNTEIISIYDLTLNFLQNFIVNVTNSAGEPLAVFNNNLCLVFSITTMNLYSLDSLSSLGSISLTNGGYANLNYSKSINSLFLIYSSVNLYINLISGKNITSINTQSSLNVGIGDYICTFEKSGYLVFLNNLGLFIYNQNLKMIYSMLFSTANMGYQYLTYNSSNIYFISGSSTLNVLNYNITEPVSNPLYPADLNLILGCKC